MYMKPVIHSADRNWRMDGITDISHEEEEAKISFKAESYQPFVLMQETFINFPIQGWELRPLGQDSVLYTIRAPLIEFGIKVKVRSKQRLGLRARHPTFSAYFSSCFLLEQLNK